MGNYLIPANSKKSMLIFGFFTTLDLIIFGSGASISILLLMIIETNDIMQVMIMCIPLLFALFMVTPIPHYHNVMTLIGNMISFYSNNRKYIWKGWCVKDVFGRDN